MSLIDLKRRVKEAIESNRPFAVFRKPNETAVKAIFQQNNATYFTSDFTRNGFVFAPFNNTEKSLFIPFIIADKMVFRTGKRNVSFGSENNKNISKTAKESHIKLIQEGINFIDDKNAEKIVLSRKETLELSNFDLFQTYERMLKKYPSAFVYLWFHPVSGVWTGATPETLVRVEKQKFKVMALASTQNYKGTLEVYWNKKEKEEHQFVIDYITSKLKKYSLLTSKTHTIKSGNLVHLCAIVSGKIQIENLHLLKLIKALHPTPAVCGFPKDESAKFILENEGYNREYYTGFLGEIHTSSTNLYVNLRCMKIDLIKQNASIYIGGGITKDSNPESEWEETVAKSNVMKCVL